MGALQFLPESYVAEDTTQLHTYELSEAELADMLRKLKSNPLGIEGDKDFRISVAGAQEKTALVYWRGTWHRPLGTTPTTHILKPQIGKLDNGLDMSLSVENEYFCIKLLSLLGLPTPEVAIQDFEDERTLVIERFDRRWTAENGIDRLPQEDFLQALGIPSHKKYQADGGPGITDGIELLRSSNNPLVDQGTFLKSQLCFWYMGATDGHAKNYSVALEPAGRFRLTPLYDVMSVEPNFHARELTRKDMRLAMCVGNSRHYRFHEIYLRHFQETAKQARLVPETIDRLAAEIKSAFNQASTQLTADCEGLVPSRVFGPILEAFERRLKSAV